MAKNNLISVIVPAYNAEKYLDRCLNSILKQTYKNLEIILVNDGSTDKTLKICKQYEKQDSRIKIINKKNEGVSIARNRGLEIARGKYIYFADADDYLEPSLLETYYDEIQDVELVVSNYYLIDPNDVCRPSNSFNKNLVLNTKSELANLKASVLCNEYKHEDIKKGYYTGTGLGFTWNKLFVKETIDKFNIRFPDHVILSEDVCFVYKYLNCIKSVKMIKESLYYHEVEETGATLRYKPDIMDSERKFIDETWYIANEQNSMIIDAYYGRLIRMISWDFISYIFHKNNKHNKMELIELLFEKIPEYKLAIKKAKYRNLTKKQAVFLFLLRHRLYKIISLLIR